MVHFGALSIRLWCRRQPIYEPVYASSIWQRVHIVWCFLNSNILYMRGGHLSSIPVISKTIQLVVVKEVYLSIWILYSGMDLQEMCQGFWNYTIRKGVNCNLNLYDWFIWFGKVGLRLTKNAYPLKTPRVVALSLHPMSVTCRV